MSESEGEKKRVKCNYIIISKQNKWVSNQKNVSLWINRVTYQSYIVIDVNLKMKAQSMSF